MPTSLPLAFVAFRVPYSLSLFVAAMAVTLVATPLVMRLARRAGALDHPGPRRIHAQPIPTMGGIALVIAVMGVAWVARTMPGPARVLELRPLIGLSLAAIPLLALGTIDDLRGIPPWVKLVIQAGSALVLSMFGYGVPLITNPFGGSLATGPFNVPLTVAWVLVVVNAINLIDGLDGLASGAVCIASMALWWVAHTHGDFYVMFVSSLVAGATLGFLRYNFPPARVFMGDTGSHFLGLVMAAASLLESRKGTATVILLFPLVAMGLPIADSVLAFIRRLLRGTPVFRADSEHIHHRLLRLGLSPRNALFVLWYLCIYLGVMAVVLAAMPREYAWMVAALLALGLVFAFEVMEFIDRKLAERPRDSDDAPP
jgi:UDP-GlcNAc:undecaprenyl-phosphate/decaprenyl-phosphate GlcNAc-1-phosphate transferase